MKPSSFRKLNKKQPCSIALPSKLLQKNFFFPFRKKNATFRFSKTSACTHKADTDSYKRNFLNQVPNNSESNSEAGTKEHMHNIPKNDTCCKFSSKSFLEEEMPLSQKQDVIPVSSDILYCVLAHQFGL